MKDLYDPHARFHPSNKIHETAIIHDNVRLGKNNVIGAYTVIGSDGEIRGVDNFQGFVEIGDNNVISEFVSIQRPATKNLATLIGDNCIIMAHSHIGHDAQIGNNCEISTGSIIGGYAKINHSVKIKLGVTVRNRKTVGSGSIVGMGSVVVKDIPKNSVVVGNPAREINTSQK